MKAGFAPGTAMSGVVNAGRPAVIESVLTGQSAATRTKWLAVVAVGKLYTRAALPPSNRFMSLIFLNRQYLARSMLANGYTGTYPGNRKYFTGHRK